MKNVLSNLLLFAILIFVGFSCKKDETPAAPSGPVDTKGSVILSGDITASRTLKASEKYVLQGFVYVKEGVTLTVEAGTVIFGDKATKGTLIIERGAKLIADGTAAKPIVFTSYQPVGQRGYGDWGGLIILGKAPVNQPSASIEGGVGRQYGGTDPNDNSGVLRYVRVEYPGIAFQPDNEINGITMGGVGAGTVMEYVQVTSCGDDSFEWFGGTVNAKYLIAHRGWDDDFDTDFGYSGRVQFAVSLRDAVINDASTSNGFESDNDGQGSNASPKTSPIFANVSVFGPYGRTGVTAFGNDAQWGRAMHIRRNSSKSVFNSVFVGFKEGLRLDGTTTFANAQANSLEISGVVLANMTVAAVNGAGGVVAADALAWFNAAGKGNTIVTDVAGLGLNAQFANLTAPQFLPSAGSLLLSGGVTNAKLSGGLTATTYRGAFGTTDWTSGWANFDPQNKQY